MQRKDIGIVGGGQLGKMLMMVGHRLGLTFAVLDPNLDCPAAPLAHQLIQAPFDDAAAIEKLASCTRRLTFEFEHIDAKALMALEGKGFHVMPSPHTLQTIQNKYRQKTFLARHQLPVPDFTEVTKEADLIHAMELFSTPLMLKSCTGGYDGKGNAKIDHATGLQEAFNALGGAGQTLMAEKCVDFLMEISVLAARDINGHVETFPVGQNLHRDHILDRTLVPAPLPDQVTRQAEELAAETMRQLKGVGLFCIEMFVDQRENLLINEIAPRTHNSGHHTIESCSVSQFEQQLRAFLGWPLIRPVLRHPAVMVNLLGQPPGTGQAVWTGLPEALSMPGVYPHIYGKTESRPGRKMGHVTVLADTVKEAEQRANRVESLLSVHAAAK